ncbi:DUF5606 family protein [Leeuwenhoekiella aequorea]|uniref:DUF5606 family protein n=1 Tax=Leeuwenhoekiella aequorea TaxID=283736 RepID=UPI000856F80D|nr:conserved hypothetical protein [uncultured bacterium]|tara:strand:- start:120 stop:668 length:549 start_codon:yes stop_codon:yes gene_type:complete
MSLDKIVSISGKPGLYHLRAQTRSGFIAESLADGKKMPVGLRHNVSVLSEISIYTLDGESPLREVFAKISAKENGGKAIDHKSSKDELEAYFFEILPNFDEDRVYPSDIKKVIQWYNLLQQNDLLGEKETENSEDSTEDSKPKAAVKAEPKTVKSANPQSKVAKSSTAKKGASAKSTAARKK